MEPTPDDKVLTSLFSELVLGRGAKSSCATQGSTFTAAVLPHGPFPLQARLVLLIVTKVCPDITEDFRDIFSMRLTCSAWHSVLQHADTRSAHISSRSFQKAASLPQFMSWLVPHAGLVGSLTLDRNLWPSCCTCGPDGVITQAVEAKTVALQGINAAVAAGMRLTRFSTNYLHSAAALRALPAATLQQLQLSSVIGHLHSRPPSSGITTAS